MTLNEGERPVRPRPGIYAGHQTELEAGGGGGHRYTSLVLLLFTMQPSKQMDIGSWKIFGTCSNKPCFYALQGVFETMQTRLLL